MLACAHGFKKIQITSAVTANWPTAAESIGLVGINYQATISTTNGLQYFRLRHP